MPMSHAGEEFVSFMVDYTDFLGRMRADENDKLSALSSRDLPRIERSISVSQANAKQLANLEGKRISLQQAAGYDGLSFRQLIDRVPQEEQGRLWELFAKFETNVADIRFFNNKSMAVARDNMLELDPSAALQGSAAAKAGGASNPYERIREEKKEASKILEQKA